MPGAEAKSKLIAIFLRVNHLTHNTAPLLATESLLAAYARQLTRASLRARSCAKLSTLERFHAAYAPELPAHPCVLAPPPAQRRPLTRIAYAVRLRGSLTRGCLRVAAYAGLLTQGCLRGPPGHPCIAMTERNLRRWHRRFNRYPFRSRGLHSTHAHRALVYVLNTWHNTQNRH